MFLIRNDLRFQLSVLCLLGYLQFIWLGCGSPKAMSQFGQLSDYVHARIFSSLRTSAMNICRRKPRQYFADSVNSKGWLGGAKATSESSSGLP